ncbi:DNA-binding transcriptional LysR family regulator [Variovorax boronicumulans]|uniref:DNA-binding transcriptional LysR family regulator n=2 Tax=Variovorax boronicumulans TaxID=436515 RepID=A0AAW8DUI3_9BURK|nr:LysR family transcriptional regulator [Variovorax boronicumulans]MDP9877693.1 DNA-binding transcriptional LysR family regulator [Variovorax boronicumulans]MDP9922977.1 DNA-binding transcriptional LysR family regulator [Variovorax boronicumulans]
MLFGCVEVIPMPGSLHVQPTMTPSSEILFGRLTSGARIRHLQAYVSVAELGSVKRAADAIGLSQPAVTSLIADLEQLLECVLFQRHARGMWMTGIAKELLPFVRRALASLERGTEFVAFRHVSANSVVRIGAIHGAICGLLVRALPPFARARPEVMIEVQEANVPRIASLLLKQEIDMMLCREPAVEPEGWGFSELMPDRLVVVAGPQHPLVEKRSLGFADLFDETWLLLHPATHARRMFDQLMEHHGLSPKYRKLDAMSTPLVLAQLQSEPLLVLAPYSVFRQLIELGQLSQLDVIDIPPFKPLGVLSPSDAEMSEAALDLKEFLYRYVNQHP